MLSFSWAARTLTIGVLATLGLLVAGLRGPGSWPAAQLELRQRQRPGYALPPTSSLPLSGTYNLAFLPADAKMVLAIRPGRSFSTGRSERSWNRSGNSKGGKRRLVFPPRTWTSPSVLGRGPPRPSRSRTPFSQLPERSFASPNRGMETHFESVLDTICQETHHAGQTYNDQPCSRRTGNVYAPDDRTLVFAQEDLLRELIEDRNAAAETPLGRSLEERRSTGKAILAVETRVAPATDRRRPARPESIAET